MMKKQKVPPTTTGGSNADNTSMRPGGSSDDKKSPIEAAHPSRLSLIAANTRPRVGTLLGMAPTSRTNHDPSRSGRPAPGMASNVPALSPGAPESPHGAAVS